MYITVVQSTKHLNSVHLQTTSIWPKSEIKVVFNLSVFAAMPFCCQAKPQKVMIAWTLCCFSFGRTADKIINIGVHVRDVPSKTS